MNTILTDDEIDTICDRVLDTNSHTCGSLIARAVEAAVLAKLARQEPFGYFRAEPFGWTDCAESDEDAVPLYAAPVAQQADRQRVPEGWKLVPVEPTPEMMVAAQEADMDHGDHDEWLEYDGEDVKRIHRAMLAAAPEAQAQAEQVPKAWMHEEDPSRVISDVQKQQAIRDGGASASSVRPYSIALVAPEAPAQADQAAEPVRDEREPSPTAGMNMAQRILHVGGRTNAAGYVEFGSVQAVDALVRHVLRDLPDAPPAQGEQAAEPAKVVRVRIVRDPETGAYLRGEAPSPSSEVDGRAALTGTERQPLPQWQIDEIIKQHTGGFIGGMHFVHLARAIEIAHGIGGKDCQPLTQWQPIETAPKNGTVIDLWHEEFGRYAGCFWGKPIHSCGEMGRFCDSDWHSLKDGWVDEFNEQHPESEFTHWMPLPAAPDAAPEAPAQANDWTPLTPEEQDRLDGLLKHARWLAESMPTMEGLQHSWALNARQVMARMHDWLNRYLPPATPCVPKKPCAVDERDRKDAERYRWLTEDHEKFETRALVCEIASALSVRGKGNIDAAIDAALEQKGGK